MDVSDRDDRIGAGGITASQLQAQAAADHQAAIDAKLADWFRQRTRRVRHRRTTETPPRREHAMKRRARIIKRSPETSPFQYDSAVALGYQPESWDGMWKLPTGYPILWLTRTWALVTEVVQMPGTHAAVMRRGKVKTTHRLRKIVA